MLWLNRHPLRHLLLESANFLNLLRESDILTLGVERRGTSGTLNTIAILTDGIVERQFTSAEEVVAFFELNQYDITRIRNFLSSNPPAIAN